MRRRQLRCGHLARVHAAAREDDVAAARHEARRDLAAWRGAGSGAALRRAFAAGAARAARGAGAAAATLTDASRGARHDGDVLAVLHAGGWQGGPLQAAVDLGLGLRLHCQIGAALSNRNVREG